MFVHLLGLDFHRMRERSAALALESASPRHGRRGAAVFAERIVQAVGDKLCAASSALGTRRR